MKNIHLKVALLFAVLCFIGGLFTLPYQMDTLSQIVSEKEYEKIVNDMPMPFSVLVIISSIQMAVVSFILAFFGLKLAKKAKISTENIEKIVQKENKMKWKKENVILSILFGLVTSFILIASDKFYFSHHIEEIAKTEPSFHFLGMMTGVFYGGIFEEIATRLVLMSLFVWLLSLVFAKNKENIPSLLYWIGIVLVSVLFGAGHLPATQMLFGNLTTIIVVRALLLNGIGGILFGYLYWKKGFEYAALSHAFTHISMQLIWITIFY